MRLSAHGIHVAERVVGRDLAEGVGIVDDGAEIVDRLQREFFAADIDERRVIGRVEPDDYVGARCGYESCERSGEHGRAHLGAATAAAHGDGGDFLERLAIGQWRQRCWCHLHLRQVVVLTHEAAIDPILPAPHPRALDDDTVARPHRVASSGRDEIERLALRLEPPQGAAGQRAADIIGERRPGADRINTGFRQLAMKPPAMSAALRRIGDIFAVAPRTTSSM